MIQVDTHSHTVASTHAYSTVHDYVVQAKKMGLPMFSLTDHGPEMPDSPHPWHFGNRHVIPRIVDGVAILKGIEANIMAGDNALDIPDGMLPFLDFAIASFHEPVFAPSDVRTNTRAVIRAIESGKCQIIGHPGNPNYVLDYAEVIRAAKDHNVLLEVNNSSFSHSRQGSEDNCKRIMSLVDELNWKVVFASDAHIAYHLADVTHCVEKARDVGFPMERVVNCSAANFLRFLGEHNKPVAEELANWVNTVPANAA